MATATKAATIKPKDNFLETISLFKDEPIKIIIT